MSLFERFCWDDIKNNIKEDFLIDISDGLKFKLYKKINNNKLFISKELLCTVIRRFISRYLIGKNEQNKINSNDHLYQYLDKDELWPVNFTKNENFKEELKNMFEINENDYITVGHSLNLYEDLGGDLDSLDELLEKKKKSDKITENINLTILEKGKNDDDKNDKGNVIIINNMNEGQNDNIIKDEINEDISDVEENEEK